MSSRNEGRMAAPRGGLIDPGTVLLRQEDKLVGWAFSTDGDTREEDFVLVHDAKEAEGVAAFALGKDTALVEVRDEETGKRLEHEDRFAFYAWLAQTWQELAQVLVRVRTVGWRTREENEHVTSGGHGLEGIYRDHVAAFYKEEGEDLVLVHAFRKRDGKLEDYVEIDHQGRNTLSAVEWYAAVAPDYGHDDLKLVGQARLFSPHAFGDLDPEDLSVPDAPD